VVQRAVAHGSVQDLLRLRARALGAGEREVVAAHVLKPSTRKTYERYLLKFYRFCDERSVRWPSEEAASVAHIGAFLASLARGRGRRPGSVLKSASAAVSLALEAHGLDNPRAAHGSALSALVLSLTRAHTSAPRSLTPVLPLAQVLDRLRALWRNGSVEALREAAVVSMSVFGLLRTKELATVEREQCAVVTVRDDAPHQLHVAMFNYKNDVDLGGATLQIPGSSEDAVCVPCIVREYVRLTSSQRNAGAPSKLILSLPRLKRASAGLSDSALGTIKNRFARALLPGDRLFLNNWTRKTGAVALLNAGIPVPDVMNHGRWRSADVFTQHYVRKPLELTVLDDIVRSAQPTTPATPFKASRARPAMSTPARVQRASPPTPSLSPMSPATPRRSPPTPSLSPMTPSLSPISLDHTPTRKLPVRRWNRNWSTLSTPSLSSSSSYRESSSSASDASPVQLRSPFAVALGVTE